MQAIKNMLKGKGKDEKEEEAPFVPEPVPAPTEPSEKVELAVTSSKTSDEEILMHVAVKCAPGAVRMPLDICCVVDVSGSMSSGASIKTGTGQTEAHGLSVLDVVKHAVKTVIHGLDPRDRVAVVAFESNAVTTFPLTEATTANKKDMEEKVDALRTLGGTNLWGGLETGMNLLLENGSDRLPAILVLTDGMPDYNPADKLKAYKDTHKTLPTINTFGFGYGVETPMLLNIAVEGNGMHAFIPDASFVGTAFVNALSNLMVTTAIHTTLSIEPENGAEIVEVFGHSSQKTSWGSLVNLCSLQYGQVKDSVARLKVPANTDPSKPIARVTLKYERTSTKAAEEQEAVCMNANDGGVALQVHQLRLAFVKTVETAVDDALQQRNVQAQQEVAKILDAANKVNDPHAKAIGQDISGQVTEALIRAPEDYFQKWGRHYLPSLARAHLLQQCNNFKDPGIQFYGGQLFETIRDKVEDIFVKLPPPKPSVRARAYYGGGGATKASAAPLASMRTYYDASGGCIAGECEVRMADGSVKRVDAVVRGDKVCASLSSGAHAEVVCVVKTQCFGGKESLVTLPGGLRLTPYHPVHKEDGWYFPLDLATPERDAACDAVYNFVLAGEHAMVVNGVECVTLGHGLSAPVVAHPYFGTQRVVDDLRRMRGWETGRVELFPSLCAGRSMVRDAKTGMVCGFAAGVDGSAVVVGVREP